MIRSQHASNLLESIRFCFAASRLEVEDLCHTLAGEDVVIPRGAFCEFQMRQQSTEIGKANVGIGVTSEDAVQCLRDFTHDATAPTLSYHPQIALQPNDHTQGLAA